MGNNVDIASMASKLDGGKFLKEFESRVDLVSQSVLLEFSRVDPVSQSVLVELNAMKLFALKCNKVVCQDRRIQGLNNLFSHPQMLQLAKRTKRQCLRSQAMTCFQAKQKKVPNQSNICGEMEKCVQACLWAYTNAVLYKAAIDCQKGLVSTDSTDLEKLKKEAGILSLLDVELCFHDRVLLAQIYSFGQWHSSIIDAALER